MDQQYLSLKEDHCLWFSSSKLSYNVDFTLLWCFRAAVWVRSVRRRLRKWLREWESISHVNFAEIVLAPSWTDWATHGASPKICSMIILRMCKCMVFNKEFFKKISRVSRPTSLGHLYTWVFAILTVLISITPLRGCPNESLCRIGAATRHRFRLLPERPPALPSQFWFLTKRERRGF